MPDYAFDEQEFRYQNRRAAIQGNFAAHARALRAAGASAVEVRKSSELVALDGLIIPGGESTTISMLLDSSGLRPDLSKWIADDRPTLGTCAGLVLLAEELTDGRADQEGLGGLDVTVQRNGYGRQRFSFEAVVDAPLLGDPVESIFIRAPRIVRVGAGVTALGRLSDEEREVVCCQQGRIIGCAYHPELAGDPRLHRRLVKLAEGVQVAG